MQQIEEQLKKLIAEYGKQLVVDEPRRTAALLLDFCAQNKREARVLIAVVEEGLTAELVRDAGKTSAAILLPRQAKRLHDELGMDEKLALWAVGAWAEALGLSLPPAGQAGHYLNSGDGSMTETQINCKRNSNPPI